MLVSQGPDRFFFFFFFANPLTSQVDEAPSRESKKVGGRKRIKVVLPVDGLPTQKLVDFRC